MCKEEKNDKACCFCAPSYVGIIIFGLMVTTNWGLNIVGLFAKLDKNFSGNTLTTEEMSVNSMSALYSTIVYAIVLVFFILPAIFQKSVAARLALFIISIVELVLSTSFKLTMAILLLRAGAKLGENPAQEYQQVSE